jgi:hypothetical protein
MFSTRFALAVFVANLTATVALPADEEGKVERWSVSARVVRAVGEGVGIHAKKEPGAFTIPEGTTARSFKYRFHDPSSGLTLDKLSGSNIYSVTEKRYITEAADNPDLALPPGKYRFVVGGRPGASGSLSFEVGPGDDTSVVIRDDVPEADLPRDGRIALVIWSRENPTYKFHWDMAIEDGVVAGTGTLPKPLDSHVENYQADYTFGGKLVGKHIEGTASQRLRWEARLRNGGVQKHTYEGEGAMELRLRVDQTVVGTEIHSGRTNGEPSIQGRKVGWIGTWQLGREASEE